MSVRELSDEALETERKSAKEELDEIHRRAGDARVRLVRLDREFQRRCRLVRLGGKT
jgi:hypothetical protein